MIVLRSNYPVQGRTDVWPSVIRLKSLSPARRSTLVTLLNSASFILRTNGDAWEVGEIRNINDLYKIRED